MFKSIEEDLKFVQYEFSYKADKLFINDELKILLKTCLCCYILILLLFNLLLLLKLVDLSNIFENIFIF